MPNFIDYYEYSKLATACYVDLFSGYSDSIIAAEVEGAKRLPEKLAQQTFIESDENPDAWSVSPGGFKSNDTEGFAATLFERPGQKVLAIRGTEPEFGTTANSVARDALVKQILYAWPEHPLILDVEAGHFVVLSAVGNGSGCYIYLKYLFKDGAWEEEKLPPCFPHGRRTC